MQGDQLVPLLPLLLHGGPRVLVDHCGRPEPANGLQQPGFQALLRLGREGRTGAGPRTAVKLSGFQKFSHQGPPHADALPFVQALIDAFTLDACVWASDWPYLKATERLDYGPLLRQVQCLLPDAADRQRLWWHTPRRWFGF